MKRALPQILLNIAVVLIGLVVLFPLAWMVSVSFMSAGEAATFPPPLLPSQPTLEHYRDLFANQGMGRYLWNSFALAGMATALAPCPARSRASAQTSRPQSRRTAHRCQARCARWSRRTVRPKPCREPPGSARDAPLHPPCSGQ